MADPDFGTDLDCGVEGLSAQFELVSGRTALVQALLHRFQTERGTLVDDRDYGLDTTAWVGMRVTTPLLISWQQALANEAKKDERVLSAKASITFDAQASTLTFALAVTTAEGPFVMTVAVTALSVDLLSVTGT
jgi:hypothetical protein